MRPFAADGHLLRAWQQWWYWTWTSCCFLALCIPVITAPAAGLWLIKQQHRYARGEQPLGARETINFLRRNTLRALPFAGAHLGVLALVAIGLLGPSPGYPTGWLVLVTAVLAAVTWLLVAPWSFVIFEQNGRTVDAIRIAYTRSLTRIDLSLTGLALIIGSVIILRYLPTTALPLVAPALPAAISTVMIKLCDRAGLRTASPGKPSTTERS